MGLAGAGWPCEEMRKVPSRRSSGGQVDVGSEAQGERTARPRPEAGRNSRPGGVAEAAAGGVRGSLRGRAVGGGSPEEELWREGSALLRRLRPSVRGGVGLVRPRRLRGPGEGEAKLGRQLLVDVPGELGFPGYVKGARP